jgi:hypothetical protein
MVIVLVLLVAAVAAWLFFQPNWMPKAPETEISEKVTAQAETIKRQSISWAEKVKAQYVKKAGLGESLNAWLAQDGLAEKTGLTKTQARDLADFQLWFENLCSRESDEVAVELGEFCARQGVDLRWLLQDGGKPEMQAALAGLVLYYGMAVRERFAVRPNAALRAWQDNPKTRDSRAFGKKLYIRLVDAGLLSTPADLLMSSEKDREQHLIGAIQGLIEKDRDEVLAHAEAALKDTENVEAISGKKFENAADEEKSE